MSFILIKFHYIFKNNNKLKKYFYKNQLSLSLNIHFNCIL